MYKSFHSTLYNGCNYISLLGLKLIHIVWHVLYDHLYWYFLNKSLLTINAFVKKGHVNKVLNDDNGCSKIVDKGTISL